MKNNRFCARAGALTALVLALCLLLSAVPMTALAGESVGSSSDKLTSPLAKTYIKLSTPKLFFTGELYGQGSTVYGAKDAVYQLYSDDWYTASDGNAYYSVYYNSKRYNVLKSDVSGDIMTDAQVESYITGTLWKRTVFDTMRVNADIKGDIRVHALQLALTKLGYFKDVIDGSYGPKTAAAVKKFQRDNNLGDDGSAGPLTKAVLYAKVTGGTVSGGTSSGTIISGSTGYVPVSGTLKTTSSVNLRKRASTSSARLAVIPINTTLDYTDATVKSGITWFEVTYQGDEGWIMGTFVTAGGNASSPAIGTVTITQKGTRVRKTADGEKTGTVLAKGTKVDLISPATKVGDYTWYNIRTSTGLVGFVRGDCAQITSTTGSIVGGTTGSTGSTVVGGSDKVFVKLPAQTHLFEAEKEPSTTDEMVSAGTILMLADNNTYTKDGVEYCSLYFDNEVHHAVYSKVRDGVMTSSQVAAYIESLWAADLPYTLKQEMDLVGDVRVYALQAGLKQLGYYTGALDGKYGGGTRSAVKNLQRAYEKAYNLEVDGEAGKATWKAMRSALNGASAGGVVGSGGSISSGSGSISVTDFGTVNRVVKAEWDYGDAGAKLLAKSSYATVMDVETGKVFKVYRWAGANHADCVPATENDTKIMCEIVGAKYQSSAPSSDQLAKIMADDVNSNANYTWPDFNGNMGGTDIKDKWDRRPALLNVNGTVYPVSIYGYPHGYYSKTKGIGALDFANGKNACKSTNYYGMMCIHFVDSMTHTGTTPNAGHQAAIETAWKKAQTLWPSLFK